MCGRFGLLHPWTDMFQAYSIISSPLNLPRRFNIAPTQPIVAITGAPAAESGDRRRGTIATLFRWGLVPSWAKDISAGAKTINARAETVAEKPSFRAAFRRRRCLIPASGFYEWQSQPKGPKQPFWITAADGGLLTFAGLWESWMSPDGDELQTCTIVTTTANESLAPIHHRMPVILAPADFAAWLDVGDGKNDFGTDLSVVQSLLRPAPDGATTAWPVSTRVNNVRNDDESLVEPAEPISSDSQTDDDGDKGPPDSGQGDLFS